MFKFLANLFATKPPVVQPTPIEPKAEVKLPEPKAEVKLPEPVVEMKIEDKVEVAAPEPTVLPPGAAWPFPTSKPEEKSTSSGSDWPFPTSKSEESAQAAKPAKGNKPKAQKPAGKQNKPTSGKTSRKKK